MAASVTPRVVPDGRLKRAQTIETEEPAIDGKHVDLAKARRAGQLPDGIGSDEGADRGRWSFRERDGQAMQDAPPVHQALGFVGGRVEVLSDLLIGDEQRPARAERIAKSAQHLHWT